MSSATKFGLSVNNGARFIPALAITDEVSVLLQQQGISPNTINRLFLPAGYTGVGTMTILCYLPSDEVGPGTGQYLEGTAKAVVGNISWVLSTNYRIQRIFASKISPAVEPETLAIVTFDDWRFPLQFHVSGSTNHRQLANQYANDWSIMPYAGEDVLNEKEGKTPNEFAGLDLEMWHLTETGNIPSLHDPVHCWDYKTWISDANFIDRVLTSCGVVAIPYIGGGGQNRMLATYIGDGWESGGDNFDSKNGVYINGQLQCAWGEVSDYSDDISWGADDVISDPMIDKLTDIPQTMPPSFTSNYHDGITGIPHSLDIQFPARDKISGKLIYYKFRDVTHGKPLSLSARYVERLIITDHIKTVAEFTPDIEDLLLEEGITEIIIDSTDEFDEVVGIDALRVNLLATRALQLSRTYYSRFYACSGHWLMQGFQTLYPWAGMTSLEYGIDFRGMPYTKVDGDVNHRLYGFNQTDFSENAIISAGGIMMSRPDGVVDIYNQTAIPNKWVTNACKVTNMIMEPGGCMALEYMVVPAGLDEDDPANTIGQVVPHRSIPGMCYMPAPIGSLGFIAWEVGDGGPINEGNYVLLLQEEVQTRTCGE